MAQAARTLAAQFMKDPPIGPRLSKLPGGDVAAHCSVKGVIFEHCVLDRIGKLLRGNNEETCAGIADWMSCQQSILPVLFI